MGRKNAAVLVSLILIISLVSSCGLIGKTSKQDVETHVLEEHEPIINMDIPELEYNTEANQVENTENVESNQPENTENTETNQVENTENTEKTESSESTQPKDNETTEVENLRTNWGSDKVGYLTLDSDWYSFTTTGLAPGVNAEMVQWTKFTDNGQYIVTLQYSDSTFDDILNSNKEYESLYESTVLLSNEPEIAENDKLRSSTQYTIYDETAEYGCYTQLMTVVTEIYGFNTRYMLMIECQSSTIDDDIINNFFADAAEYLTTYSVLYSDEWSKYLENSDNIVGFSDKSYPSTVVVDNNNDNETVEKTDIEENTKELTTEPGSYVDIKVVSTDKQYRVYCPDGYKIDENNINAGFSARFSSLGTKSPLDILVTNVINYEIADIINDNVTDIMSYTGNDLWDNVEYDIIDTFKSSNGTVYVIQYTKTKDNKSMDLYNVVLRAPNDDLLAFDVYDYAGGNESIKESALDLAREIFR